MGLFSRKKDKENPYSSYHQSEDNYDSCKSDEDALEVGIKFKKELSNGSLVFLIVDDDFDWIGSYIVVSANGVANIVDNKFEDYSDQLNDIVCSRLKETAEAFYQATK